MSERDEKFTSQHPTPDSLHRFQEHPTRNSDPVTRNPQQWISSTLLTRDRLMMYILAKIGKTANRRKHAGSSGNGREK